MKAFARTAPAEAGARGATLLPVLMGIKEREKANFPTVHAVDRCLVHLLRTARPDASAAMARALAGADADTIAAVTEHARRLARQPAESDDEDNDR